MRTAGLGIEQPRVLGSGDQLEPHTPGSAEEAGIARALNGLVQSECLYHLQTPCLVLEDAICFLS